VLAASAALLIAAPAAVHGAGLTVDAPCYQEGALITVSGAGFDPFAPVALTGVGLAAAAATTDEGGEFVTSVLAPSLDTQAPATQVFTLTGSESQGSDPAASVDVLVTTFSAQTSSRPGPFDERVRWRFAGFASGAPVFGHFRLGGRTYANYRFGVTGGPCGTLSARAPRLPVAHAPAGNWLLQLDGSPHFHRHTTPALRYHLVVARS
jgi:hypothetical protein